MIMVEITSGKRARDLEKRLGEISDVIYQGQFEQTKDRFKKDDKIFQKYEPEISARLMQLTPRERLDSEKIKTIRQEVMADHFEEILQDVKEDAIRSIQPKPQSTPSVNDVTDDGGSLVPSRSGMTPEQKTTFYNNMADKGTFQKNYNFAKRFGLSIG